MEYRQTNISTPDLRLIRWLEGAGIIISSILCALYFGLAVGYQNTFNKNFSGPGINLFEFLAVAYFIIASSFVVLLIFSSFRLTLTLLLCHIPFLALLVLQSLRVYYLRLEEQPVLLEQYSKGLVWFSYIDLLLIAIILALWTYFGHRGFGFIRKNIEVS